MRPGYEAVLTPGGARVRGGSRPHLRAARGASCWRAARAPGRSTPASARLPARDGGVRAGDWTVAPLPQDLLDRRVEITGPSTARWSSTRSTRARTSSWRTSRTPTRPTWDNHGRRPAEPARRRPPHHHVRRRREGKSYALERQDRRRSSCARAAGTCVEKHLRVDGAARPRRALRLRAVLLPQREGAARARHGPVLLPAEAGEPPRGAALERRLRPRAGAARRPARHASRPRCSSRRSPPRSRWTRSSTSCASTRRASTAGAGTTSSASSRSARDDPAAVLPDRAQVTMDKGFLRAYVAAAHPDLPPPRRARDGRHGRADPDQERPGGERGGAREGARRQAARGERRPRRHLGRAPGPRADREGDLRRAHAGPEPARREARGRARRRARICSRVPEGTRTEAGPAPQRARRRPVPRGVAARQRLRAALQPDGRRGDRGDLARAGLAVAAPPASTVDGEPLTSERFARRRRRGDARIRREVGDARFAGGRFPRPRELFDALVDRDRRSKSSSPCPPTTLLDRRTETETPMHAPPSSSRLRRSNRAPRSAQALRGHRRDRTRKADVERLRGSVQIEHTLAQLGARAALGAAAHRAATSPRSARSPATRPCRWCARASRRSTSRGWQVAADANTSRADVPRPEPLPGRQRPDGRRAASTQSLQRADQIEHAEGKRRPLLVRADRRRRRGRLRRPAQRLRADEGDDRGGRRGRPLRGPARQREEVRPHGRQGARADVASSSARSSPRASPPTCCDVPTLLVARTDADSAKLLTSDVDERDRPFITSTDRTPEGFFRLKSGVETRHRARPRLRAVRGPGLVRDVARPTSTQAKQVRRGHPREVPGQAARVQLLAVVQLEEEPRRRDHRQVPARARRDGLQVPVRHAGRASTRSTTRCSSSRASTRTAAWRRTRELQQAEFAAEKRRLHGHAPPARGRHRATSTRSPRSSPAATSSTLALEESTEAHQF